MSQNLTDSRISLSPFFFPYACRVIRLHIFLLCRFLFVFIFYPLALCRIIVFFFIFFVIDKYKTRFFLWIERTMASTILEMHWKGISLLNQHLCLILSFLQTLDGEFEYYRANTQYVIISCSYFFELLFVTTSRLMPLVALCGVDWTEYAIYVSLCVCFCCFWSQRQHISRRLFRWFISSNEGPLLLYKKCRKK